MKERIIQIDKAKDERKKNKSDEWKNASSETTIKKLKEKDERMK